MPFLPRLHSDEKVHAWLTDTVTRRCRMWVARRDGRLIGFVALDGDERDQLYVLPGYYRQGVGSRLLALAKQESSGQLRLFTFQRNTVPGSSMKRMDSGWQS
ncbi:GNAT family N-acetyltransferase [Rhodopila sp.]|uniref:GNAT family N-acetyltransferase n=1 Tax=Rhodopila sp. TaxID=2480087 RepID=UPI003D10D124